MRVITDTLMLM